MAGLLLLVCFGLLMLGLATAGPDGPLLQGRSIAECDSNCGTWCCPPAYHCGYVDMAGGWSCFENTSYSQSASTEAPSTVSIEIPTTATAHNVVSTTLRADFSNLEQAWDAVLKNADGSPQEGGKTVEHEYEPTDEQSMLQLLSE
ncbi:hypothetical protein AUP68_07330 [Ilyonectria robusta]